MTWVRLIGVMPLILGGAVCAQSPNEKVTPLESCFRSSRLADAICMKQNDPAQRLDCLHKTSAAQLECLEHALPEPATASENSSGTVLSGPPANAASSEAPSQSASPKEPGRAEAPAKSTGSIPAKEADSPPKTDGTVPSGLPANAASSEAPSQSASPKEPGRTEAPEVSTGSIPAKEADSPPKTDGTVPSGPPANAASSEAPSQSASPKEPGRTEAPEVSTGSIPAREADSPPKTDGTVPSGPPANAASSEAPSQSASPKEPGRTEAPEVSTGSIPAKEADSPPKTDLRTNPASNDVTGAIRLDAPGKIADVPTLPAQTNWIVSETTSPLKYRTLVTAVIHATPVVENGPNTLTIGCRRQRTELSVGMEGNFGAPRRGKPQIDSQINDQPAVRQRWAWSADRKLATYRDNPIRLLQSVPEGATLKIAVSDRDNARHEATFQLTGLDSVRKKVAAACKWAPVQAKTAAETR